MPNMGTISKKTDLKGGDSVEILARMMYQEAGGESNEGKRGVAFTAQNRHKSSEFPNNYYDVIVASGEFQVALKYRQDNTAERDAYDACYDIAGSMSSQTNPIGSRLYFSTKSSITGYNDSSGNGNIKGTSAGRYFTDGKLIGTHVFYGTSKY